MRKRLTFAMVLLIASSAWARQPAGIGSPIVMDANNVPIGPYMRDVFPINPGTGPAPVDDVVVNINGTFFALPWAGGEILTLDPSGFLQTDATLEFASNDCSGPAYMGTPQNAAVVQVISIARLKNGVVQYPDPTATPSTVSINSILNTATNDSCFSSGTPSPSVVVPALTATLPTNFVRPFHLSVPGE